jgi:hypothetical protein
MNLPNLTLPFDLNDSVAIIPASPYWLAGGRNADKKTVNELKNPQHKLRQEWRSKLKEKLQGLTNKTLVIPYATGTSTDAALTAKSLGMAFSFVCSETNQEFSKDEAAEVEMLESLKKDAVAIITHPDINDEGSRKTWMTQNIPTAISASHINGTEEQQYTLAGKPVQKVLFPLSPNKGGVVPFFTVAIPSYGENEKTQFLIPVGENDLLGWNEEQKTTELKTNTLVTVQNINTYTLPENTKAPANVISKLGQYQIENIEIGTVEELFDAVKNKKITLPKELDLAFQINGEYNIKKMLGYALALQPEDVRAPLHRIASSVLNAAFNPTFVKSPEGKDITALENDRLTANEFAKTQFEQVATLLDPEATDELKNKAKQALNSNFIKLAISSALNLSELDLNTLDKQTNLAKLEKSDLKKRFSDLAFGAEQLKVEEILNNPSNEELFMRVRSGQITIPELMVYLSNAKELQLGLASGKRRNDPILFGVSEAFSKRTGIKSDEMYAGEINAWVHNTLKKGRVAGATIDAQMGITHQPSLNQENHQDSYRSELPDVISTQIDIPNLPGSLLPTYREIGLDPITKEFLNFTNTLRFLAEEKALTQETNNKVFQELRMDVVTKALKKTTVKTTQGNDLSESITGLLQITIEDIDYAKFRRVWAEELTRNQSFSGIDPNFQARPMAHAGWMHKNEYAPNDHTTQRQNRGQITAQAGNRITSNFDLNHNDDVAKFALSRKAYREVVKALSTETDKNEKEIFSTLRGVESIFEGVRPEVLQKLKGTQQNKNPQEIITQKFKQQMERMGHLQTASLPNNFGISTDLSINDQSQLDNLKQLAALLNSAVMQAVKDPSTPLEIKNLIKNVAQPLWYRSSIALGLQQLPLTPERKTLVETIIKQVFAQEIKNLEETITVQTQMKAESEMIEATQTQLNKINSNKNNLEAALTQYETLQNTPKEATQVTIHTNQLFRAAEELHKTLSSETPDLKKINTFLESQGLPSTPETQAETIKLGKQILTICENRHCNQNHISSALMHGISLVAKHPGTLEHKCFLSILAQPKENLENQSPIRKVTTKDGEEIWINRMGLQIQTSIVNICQGHEIAQHILQGLESGKVINGQNINQALHRRQRKLYETSAEEKSEESTNSQLENRTKLKADQTWIDDQPAYHPANLFTQEEKMMGKKIKIDEKVINKTTKNGFVELTTESKKIILVTQDSELSKIEPNNNIVATIYPNTFEKNATSYRGFIEHPLSVSAQLTQLGQAGQIIYGKTENYDRDHSYDVKPKTEKITEKTPTAETKTANVTDVRTQVQENLKKLHQKKKQR